MARNRRQALLNAYKIADVITMAFSFLMATSAVSYQIGRVSLLEFLSMRVKVQNVLLFLGFLAAWHVVFSLYGIYSSGRETSGRSDIVNIIKASSVATAAVFASAIIFEVSLVTTYFTIVFWLLVVLLSSLARVILRYILGRVSARHINRRHFLIVGTNPRAVKFAEKIESGADGGYQIIGFVDDEWPGLEEFRKREYALLGSLKDMPNLLRNQVIDEVAIALPVKSFYGDISDVVAHCEQQGIIVRFASQIFNPTLARSEAGEIEEGPVITFYAGGMREWAVGLKRTLDFCISLILLLVFSPLFLVVSLLVKLTSPGPVFFVQQRVGLNKRRFRMYKFRTMIADAERRMEELKHLNEAKGPVFKITKDPRVTRIGKWLRKTSIDELPQLINVLKGDMSLVGPRPLPLRDVEGFDQDWQRRRFSVRPGITGLWQVNGRSNIPFEHWMELDMQYIDEWSLWLDLKILAKTVPAVLKGIGAA